MPTNLFVFDSAEFRLDARPDRIDLRDREFRPKLVSLPDEFPTRSFVDEYFDEYKHLVGDQGEEGACTGFGLAAMINYLRFRRAIENGETPPKRSVSKAMLYHMARLYDEWDGEDYDGSSCRGAMKGWHKHGVCFEENWPYNDNAPTRPLEGWAEEAATIPLGSYYRVNKKSISDVQAAIFETGAVYVSARVHAGWRLKEASRLPIIEHKKATKGIHAFALVGYNELGFIVQNSWGDSWGMNGFAILTYQDWAKNATDVWVSVLGARVRVKRAAYTTSEVSLSEYAALQEASSPASSSGSFDERWDVDTAREHSLVLGNNGAPINRFLEELNANTAVERVVSKNVRTWARKSSAHRKIMIYAHGGLNSEAASMRRIQGMGRYFLRDEVYPLFITWKTGFGESLFSSLKDVKESIVPERSEAIKDAWIEVKERLSAARDYAVEIAARELLIKAIWSEMKENASASAEKEGGINELAKYLAGLATEFPDLEIHLVGHSAGSILLGHLLSLMTRRKQKVASCHLYAPACTLDFANRFYGHPLSKGTFSVDNFYIDMLGDNMERKDHVGTENLTLYGKSLLYLVSRALERNHKTPLLGMEAGWNVELEQANDIWRGFPEIPEEMRIWLSGPGAKANINFHGKTRSTVATAKGKSIPLSHGSFDNDVKMIQTTLTRVLGRRPNGSGWDLSGF